MVKCVKYIILSLFFITLVSCATKDNSDNSQMKLIQDRLVSDEEASVYDDETSEFNGSEKEKATEKFKKMNETLDVTGNAQSTFLRDFDTKPKIKKVERKKIIIKPVNDYNRDLHNLSDDEIEAFFEDIESDETLEESKKYDSQSIKVLMENYKNILKTSSACCASGVSENLKMDGISKDAILSILNIDAGNDGIIDRCIVFSEDDIIESFKHRDLSNTIIKSRKDCICNNKEFLRKNINNFYRLYNTDEDFYEKPLIYKYRDKTGDVIEDDVNEAVLNMALTLESCP